jgi:hypothetical protein
MMRVFVSALILSLFLFAKPGFVLADYQKSYDDYTYNFSKYRDAHNTYDIAKSTYATYKTLTAKEEAIKQTRLVLQSRDKLMSSYYDLLYEKLLTMPAISNEQRGTFFTMKESEKKWMENHQKVLDAASTLEDLNSASGQFEEHFPQFDSETKQAIGMVLLSKSDVLLAKWSNQAESISNQFKIISSSGEDVGLGERGIVSARNKKEMAVTKIESARAILTKNDYSKINLFDAQQKLTEGMQYLREATQFLQEVMKGITG